MSEGTSWYQANFAKIQLALWSCGEKRIHQAEKCCYFQKNLFLKCVSQLKISVFCNRILTAFVQLSIIQNRFIREKQLKAQVRELASCEKSGSGIKWEGCEKKKRLLQWRVNFLFCTKLQRFPNKEQKKMEGSSLRKFYQKKVLLK